MNILAIFNNVLKVGFKYPKELRELHNDYSLAPDKTENKREILSEYQLNIADLYNIPIGILKLILILILIFLILILN